MFPRGRGENAVFVVDSLPHELEKLPAGVAPGLKAFRELLHKLVSLREDDIIRIGIVNPVNSHVPQSWVVDMMVGHVVAAPKRLIEVVA